jgi:tetratricopeptide (TPR) repeat protein
MGVADLKNKAREAFRRKNYDLAVRVYLEAIHFEPNDGDIVEGFFQAARKAREGKGRGMFGGLLSRVTAGANRDPKKRLEACYRGLATNPDDKGLLMGMAGAALELGADESAVGGFKRAAEADPEDNEAWKRLGEALGRRGRIVEALQALDAAVRIAPRDQEALKLRKNLAAEGALKGGFESARSSRELIKDKEMAQQLEVETRIQLTPDHAASEIEKVEQQVLADPGNVRLHVRLGELYLQKPDEAAALRALGEALRLDPRNFDLSVRIGDLKLRRLKEAAERAKAAHDAAPTDPARRAARDQAFAALLEGRLEEYGRRVNEHPLDLAERFKLGQTFLQAGRVEEATAEFQQTVRDPNRKTESLLLLARCFERSNLLTLAIKKVEEAVADFPSLASPRAKDVHYAHADLLARAGRAEEARVVFERIYEEDITYRDVPARLRELEAARGAG